MDDLLWDTGAPKSMLSCFLECVRCRKTDCVLIRNNRMKQCVLCGTIRTDRYRSWRHASEAVCCSLPNMSRHFIDNWLKPLFEMGDACGIALSMLMNTTTMQFVAEVSNSPVAMVVVELESRAHRARDDEATIDAHIRSVPGAGVLLLHFDQESATGPPPLQRWLILRQWIADFVRHRDQYPQKFALYLNSWPPAIDDTVRRSCTTLAPKPAGRPQNVKDGKPGKVADWGCAIDMTRVACLLPENCVARDSVIMGRFRYS